MLLTRMKLEVEIFGNWLSGRPFFDGQARLAVACLEGRLQQYLPLLVAIGSIWQTWQIIYDQDSCRILKGGNARNLVRGSSGPLAGPKPDPEAYTEPRTDPRGAAG